MRRWRSSWFVACGVAFYVLLVAFAGVIGRIYALGKAEDLLKFAAEDIKLTVKDWFLNYMLSYAAYSLEEELGTAGVYSKGKLDEYRRIFNVDEINIAGSNGQWIASSEDSPSKIPLGQHPDTAEYLALTNGGAFRVFQPFRASVSSPQKRRKYVGLPFCDGSGIIQIGLDESRVIANFDSIFYGFFDGWDIGDQRFYLLADPGSGRVQVCGEKDLRQSVVGRTLSGLGFRFDPADVQNLPQTGHVSLGGVPCSYRMDQVLGRILISLIPDREFYDVQILVTAMSAALLGIVLVFVFIVFRVQRKSRHAELRLHAERIRQQAKERKRATDDLALARNIQRSSLPSVFPPYPRDLTIDLFADMAPARDVGGDFYDFFHVGSGRLAVLVADVSGKGVPAAMFMMKAKSVLRELVLSMSDLGEIVAKANERLCEGNDADMFVTCWIGILNEGTGELRYVNAGHNPPYIRRANGALEALKKVSGLFLGGMEGIRYRTFTARLAPDDLLFLYTDGVTEANNVLGEFFGEARLEETLTGRRGLGLARFMPQKAALTSPTEICRRMRGAVDAFAGKAAQYDDITLLALLYRGKPQTESLELPAVLDSVPKFNAFAEERLDGFGCRPATKADLLVALDEITNNVAQYSGSERMTVVVEMARNPSVVRFTVTDAGKAWNPLEHLDPDITLSADERAIGGLGILMVKKLMDDVSYVHDQGRNVLRFRKQF